MNGSALVKRPRRRCVLAPLFASAVQGTLRVSPLVMIARVAGLEDGPCRGQSQVFQGPTAMPMPALLHVGRDQLYRQAGCTEDRLITLYRHVPAVS